MMQSPIQSIVSSVAATLPPIASIVKSAATLDDYTNRLNHFLKNNKKNISETLSYARTQCTGLPTEEELMMLKTDKSCKDKGLFGKIIEYGLFGQKPNSDSSPDLVHLDCDIKSCVFKTLKNTGKKAKERQTLTNCGNTNDDDDDSFKNIRDNENITDCKHYKKIGQFLLFVREDDGIKFKTFEQIMEQRLLVIVWFNIEHIPLEMRETINRDYAKIRQSILEKKVSQKGQEFLHIHPHGAGHGSGNRALGFTPNFITRMVALKLAELNKKNIEEVLLNTGKYVAIKKEYL
jgi:hypothetical protein